VLERIAVSPWNILAAKRSAAASFRLVADLSGRIAEIDRRIPTLSRPIAEIIQFAGTFRHHADYVHRKAVGMDEIAVAMYSTFLTLHSKVAEFAQCAAEPSR
jgi:hypothetical protein